MQETQTLKGGDVRRRKLGMTRLFLRYLYEIFLYLYGVLWCSSFPFSQLSFSILTAPGCVLSFKREQDNEIFSNFSGDRRNKATVSDGSALRGYSTVCGISKRGLKLENKMRCVSDPSKPSHFTVYN